MRIDYTVTLDYGDGPDEDEPVPGDVDMAAVVRAGMVALGWTSADVEAVRQ